MLVLFAKEITYEIKMESGWQKGSIGCMLISRERK